MALDCSYEMYSNHTWSFRQSNCALVSSGHKNDKLHLYLPIIAANGLILPVWISVQPCFLPIVHGGRPSNYTKIWFIQKPNTEYSWYIAVMYITELDISRSHVWPHFWCPTARYFSRNHGNSLGPIRGRQFFAKSTWTYLSMRAGTHAVRWSATLGGALTHPLCCRVGSS